MKKIEKTTTDNDTMTFEVIETKTELKSFLKDLLCYFDDNGLWIDEDNSLSFYDLDGNCHWFGLGEKFEKLNVYSSKIVSMIEINDNTTIVYGDVEIVQNEKYGDWQAVHKSEMN
jgi:hypothetical protein